MDFKQSENAWDVIVVGGSAAGLSAALMLGRARRRVLVIDAGSPRNRFAAHMHGVLGHENTPPAELVRAGRQEAAGYGVRFQDGSVTAVSAAGGAVRVQLADASAATARAIIVATGITDELPDIAGVAQRWGTSVLHCPYCHGWEVRDQRLGVLATGPLGIHQAHLIRQWSEHVAFFTAGAGQIDQATERRLRSRGVELYASPVVEVLGTAGGAGTDISAVRLADGQIVDLDAIFTFGAPRPHDGFLAGLDLARTDNPLGGGTLIKVDAAGRSSHERVWAVGNVVAPTASVPMVVGAGALTGAAVNGALVEEDFDRAAPEDPDRATAY